MQNKNLRCLGCILSLSFSLYYLSFTLFLGLLGNRALLAQTPPSDPSSPPTSPPPIIVDTASQGKTGLETAPNGVAIVNIAKPNGAGVSHNLFQSFNVEQKGLVLNNHNQLGQSKLAGALVGNPNFEGGNTARLIVNEVTGASRSELKGYTEIFGGRADYVLANPYGITCDGCGFINTPRVTLSTGRPQFQNGSLHRLEVEQGDITIRGQGANTGAQAGENAKVDYFDLVSRTVTIQGPIHAAKLRIYGGQNNFHYANQHIVQRPSGNDGNSPTWALDAAAVGSMYANTIFIKLTEKGAGARLGGQMAASGDDVIITADDRLEITGQISAQRNVDLKSNTAVNINSSIYGKNNSNINADQITVGANGRIFSSNNINITAQQMQLELGAQIAAGVNDAGILSRQGRVIANLSQGLTNLGIIAAGMELQMTAGASVNNQGTFYSNDRMNLYFNEFINDEGAEILASGNLLMARNGSQGRAARMINQSGRIESRNGDITVRSDIIENKRNNSVRVRRIRNDPGLPGNRDSADFVTGSTSENTHIAEIVSNSGAGAGEIFSGRDMNLYANETRNMYSIIYASANLNINSNSVINEGTQLGTVRTTLNWIYNRDLGDECRGEDILGNCNTWNTVWGASSTGMSRRVINASILRASLGAGNGIRIRDAAGQANVNIQNRNTAVNADIAFVTDNNAGAPAWDLFSGPGTSLPTGRGGLFVVSSDPNSPYLIETRELFTSMDQYIGSDYFFERSGLRLEDFEYYQRLGDPFYETRLIQKQIFEHRGTRYLENDIFDDAEQMRRLFDNAVKEQEMLELVPGIRLTPKAAKSLTSDIIWMEERMVQGKKVLVPQLYLAEATDENSRLVNGALRARNINIKAASIVNEGSIIADENLKLLTTRGNIENILGVIEGGTVVIDSADNILNEGGSILGERLLLHAVRDIVNETITQRVQTNEDNYKDFIVSEAFIGTRADFEAQAEAREAVKEKELVRETLGHLQVDQDSLEYLANASVIDPASEQTKQNSGLLQIIAGGSILNAGGRIESQGGTQLQAGRDIVFNAVTLGEKSESYHSGGFEKSFRRKHLGASLKSLGELQISAGADLLLFGSRIDTDSQADIDAAGNINVMHLLDVDYYDKKTTTTKKDIFNSKTTVERKGYYRETVIGSGISARADLNLNADGGVLLSGSILKAGGNLRVGDILIVEDGNGNLSSKEGQRPRGLAVMSAGAKNRSWHEKKTSRKMFGVDHQELAAGLGAGLGLLSKLSGYDLILKQAMPTINDKLKSILKGSKEENNRIISTSQHFSKFDAGQELSLNSSEDILVQGSHLASGSDMEIKAQGSIAVLSGFAHKQHYKYQNQTDFEGLDWNTDLSGDNFKYTGKASFKETANNSLTRSRTQVLSSLISGGKISINAKEDVRLMAGNRAENDEEAGLTAYRDIDIKSTEGNVSILSANEVSRTIEEDSEFTVSLSFSLGNAIIEGMRTAYRTGRKLNGEEDFVPESQNEAEMLRHTEADPDAKHIKPYKDAAKAAQSLNFLGSLGSLGGFAASLKRTGNSASSYGFYLEAGLDLSGTSTKTQRQNEKAIASLVQSLTGDITLEAKKELMILGSDIISYEGDINLRGEGKVIAEALAQDQSMERKTTSGSGSLFIDTTKRLRGSASISEESLTSKSTFWRHSHLLAEKGTLNIISGGDTLLRGVVGKAKHVIIDSAGELKMETLQDTSHTELEGYSYSLGGNSDGGFDLSSSTSEGLGEYRWSNIQTALIGTESVDIQTEKLSLIGAKIANEYQSKDKQRMDGGDLRIRANEITYQDLSDIDRSEYQKIGAGLKAGGEGLDSLNFQFAKAGHDKQGFTRTTVGQGDIISLDDVSGINRDLAKTQEITKNEIQEAVNIGLNVNLDVLMTPYGYWKRIADLPENLQELGEELFKDTEKLPEKTENYFQTGYFEEDSLLVPALYRMIDEDIKLTEGQEAKLDEVYTEIFNLSSPDKYQQNSRNTELVETLGIIFSNAKSFEFDAGLEAEQMDLIATWHRAENSKERRKIRQRVNEIERHKGYFHRVQRYLNRVSPGQYAGLSQAALGSLCNVIAYNLHGRATGTDERSLGDFIEAELQKGNLGWNPVQNKISLPYSSGSGMWRKDRGMSRISRKDYNKSKAELGPRLTYGEYIRRKLNKSGEHVAIGYQDTRKSGRPNHFFLIVRDKNGVWRNMDHTSNQFDRREDMVKWDKVHSVDFIGGKQ